MTTEPLHPFTRDFEQVCATHAERPAVLADTEHYSYAQLNQAANRIAHALEARGVTAEACVGICLDRSFHAIAAMIGVMKAGGAFVPLDPDYPSERLHYMLEDAAIRLVITQAEHAAQYAGLATTVLDIATDFPDTLPSDNLTHAPGADQLAYVMYTSGSTGKPKGVQIEHAALRAYCLGDINAYALERDDCTLQFSTLNFDICIEEIFPPLLVGSRIAIRPQQRSDDSNELSALIQRFGVTAIHIATAYWHEWINLLEARDEPIPESIRLMVVTGEKVSVSHYHAWCKRVSQPVLWANAYGPTEATVSATVFVPSTDWDGDAMPIGKPLLGYSTHILDEALAPVADGDTGELYIGGPALSRGYLNRDDLTQAAFIEWDNDGKAQRIYKTGDLARYRDDGNIDFAGRIDHQIKIGSYRVEPGEIENALNNHPDVIESLVVGETRNDKKRILAYVATDSADVDAVHTWLGEQLPVFMLPAAYVCLSTLPKTINGKIDRDALPDGQDSVMPHARAFVAPRDALEQDISNAWATVFGTARIGIHDNFFDLGGNSLMALQAITALHGQIGKAPSAREFYAAATIADQAQLLRDTARVHIAPTDAERLNTPVPLTAEQAQLYYQQQLFDDVTIYNIYEAVRIRGPLDAARLSNALDAVVARQRIFSARVVEQDGQVLQQFGPAPKDVLHHEQLTRDDTDLQAWIDDTVYRAFDLQQESPFRFVLLQLGEQEALLMLVMHHLFADGWSMSLLLQELQARYAEHQDAIKPVAREFHDYTLFRVEHDASADMQRQTDYWVDKLEGLTPLVLPQAKPQPVARTFSAQELQFTIPEAAFSALDDYCGSQRFTRFNVLLAAFKALLFRYSQTEDLAVAIVHSGRAYQAIENTFGYFAKPLITRTQIDLNDTFSQLAEKVKDTCVDAFAHQDALLSEVAARLRVSSDANAQPFASVLFLMQDIPDAYLQLPGLDCEPTYARTHSSDFDMVFELSEQNGHYRGRLVYSTELYDPADMTRMAAHFQRLLDDALSRPDERVTHLTYVSDAEQHHVLHTANQTHRDYPRDSGVEELIWAQAARTPDAPAVHVGDTTLPYAELTDRADRLASRLVAEGVGPDTLIGIFLQRGLDLLISLLAVMRSGAAYLPMDPEYPAERVSYILGDAQAPLLITQTAMAAELPPLDAKLIDLDTAWPEILTQTPLADARRAGPHDLAYVIYTSGSTGRPKGVQLSRRNVTNFICTMQQTPGMTADDTLLAVTTISFDIAVLELYLPLVSGASVDIASREMAIDGEALAQRIRTRAITQLQATPATWRLLLEADAQFGPGFKALIGGEALPRDLIAPLLARVGELWNMYGPSETTVWSTCVRVTDAHAPITIGTPIANTSIYILGPGDRPTAVNVPGELCIGGEGVARGYANRPELSAEKFVPDPFATDAPTDAEPRMYRTGDAARWREDGQLEYIGRLDNQIKLRGYRIELGEIEGVLAEHPDVDHGVALVREDTQGTAELVAYLVPNGERRADAAELRAHLQQRLPDYMVPRHLLWLDTLPQTPNGKVDRKRLPDPEWQTDTRSAKSPPVTDTEKRVAALWQDLLGHDDIGADDSFFAAGGHSLMAMRFIVQARETFDVDLPVRTVINATLAEIAVLINPDDVRAADAGMPQRDQLQPVFFDEPPRYGVLHTPADAPARTPVLICPPIGHEYTRTHRTLKLLAIALARSGHPVLRFDYTGSGDSAGMLEKASVGQWVDDIQRAANYLKTQSQHDQLVLVGARLGAALALQADIPGLSQRLLWEPVIDGDAYINAARAMHRDALHDLDRFRWQQKHCDPTELLGYRYGDALLNELRALRVPDDAWSAEATTVLHYAAGEHAALPEGVTQVAVPGPARWFDAAYLDDILLDYGVINRIKELLG
ncbi:MAG TPA: hypothetical protein DD979_15085 [Gammaproteobacteria bacterium]|nr:hypothetical protein [Gammaproteobacteria bacterium]